eukprot:2736617-Alexandrium_andersonii.AAC.1
MAQARATGRSVRRSFVKQHVCVAPEGRACGQRRPFALGATQPPTAPCGRGGGRRAWRPPSRA